MYCPRWDWVAVLVVQLCLVGCSADYFWDGTEWRWQVSAQGSNYDINIH